MTKILRVIDPFFIMELGDTFEYSEDTNMYISKHNEEFYKTDSENDKDLKSSYNSEFQISVEYAKVLIDEGYLEEVNEQEKSEFVNVFDEIDKLMNGYQLELKNLNKLSDMPACMKVEKETVLTNLITLLEHLKSLKK